MADELENCFKSSPKRWHSRLSLLNTKNKLGAKTVSARETIISVPKIKLIWTESIKFNDDNLVSVILCASLRCFLRVQFRELALRG